MYKFVVVDVLYLQTPLRRKYPATFFKHLGNNENSPAIVGLKKLREAHPEETIVVCMESNFLAASTMFAELVNRAKIDNVFFIRDKQGNVGALITKKGIELDEQSEQYRSEVEEGLELLQ